MIENTNQNEQWVLLVFLLDEIRKQNNLSINDIAERTETAQGHVSRFFSAKYEPKIGNFLKYAKAVGVNFFFEGKKSKTDLNLAMEKAMETLGRRPDKLPKN